MTLLKPVRVQTLGQTFAHAVAGFGKAFATEQNLKIHTLIALLVIAAGFYFEIGRGEWAAIAMTIGMMFAVELVNTAIEYLGEAMTHGAYSEPVRAAKDISAAACLLVAIMAVVVGWLVFWPRLAALWFTH